MKIKKQIFWQQGLFLQPHHFQQLNLNHEYLLSFLAGNQQPYFWGIKEISIREAALKNKVFEINKGTFIFQDGAIVSIPDNATIDSRPFKMEKFTQGKPVKVYLGLRKWNEGGVNLTTRNRKDPGQKIETRFMSDSTLTEIPNLFEKGQSANMHYIDYQLKIFWEDEIKDAGNYNLIPVAVIEYQNDQLMLDQKFIPPTISVSGSEILLRCVRDIFDHLLLRCNQLGEYKENLKAENTNINAVYLTYILALNTLNRYASLFNHLLENAETHPWLIYGLLRQIIGELSTFDPRYNVLGKAVNGTSSIPNYDHDNLAQCFYGAQNLITEILSNILIGPENVIRLKRQEQQFNGEIPRELLSGDFTFYLAITTSTEQEKIFDEITNNAKLSTIDAIPILVSRSIPGIELSYYPQTPLGVPKKENTFYFKLIKSHEQWLDIVKNHDISLYWDKAPEDIEAEIVVLKN